ncbi:NACHT, LRR and PYD domains-containing protein 3-like [Pristis pectinata]|uniref:NACHT, LRR and PYD domains-containing protein 3-like n=1 Tax=Pristis pectinata TaxID=685728 RepID=UPI00223D6DF0|nr:NACHT, LRR and PYD domains-containing protein 3-like [Pristis pectinata]
MATDSKAAITELLSKWDDYQLSQLSRIHRARLEQAIEEEVEGVSFLLTYKGHISVQDHQEVVKLRERGYRVDGSKLLVSLVINQDTHVHRLIWKSFLKLHRILPKLEALLKEMQELASNPTEGLKFVECLSDQAAQLKEHRNLGPTVTIIVEGASGGDAVTSTSRKHGGRKLTRRQKVFKRILPVGSSRQDDQDTVTTKAKQGRIEGSVPMECAPTLEEREGSQPSGSGIRDTIQGHGTGPSEAIACDVGGSLIKESSNLKHGAEHQMLGSPVTTMAEDANRGLDTVTSKSKKDTDPKTAMSELLTQCGDYQLFRLSNFYRERLKPAIEEGVEGLSLMLRDGQHFSGQEHEKVTELVEKRNRIESSKLFFSLVMEKGSRARRVMWESFVKMRNELPKLDKILNEIQELGRDPYEYMDIGRDLCDLSAQLKDVQQKHKETLRAQTETMRVNRILTREKVKVFQLVDRYIELTVISAVRDRRLVEHELLARGRDHEQWTEKQLQGELKKFRTDELFQCSFFQSKSKSGRSAAVAGAAGIGKTTMVQKIVHDWATGKLYQHYQFIFSFKFRHLNSINCRINLRELILDLYPYFGNILEEVLKNPEGLLFIFDGLDEFKHRIDFADSRGDTEPRHVCPDPEWRCEVSEVVYSLIQHKLLPGCSVLVTTRPTALHLLKKAEISDWAEILGFVRAERKEYFHRFFEDQTVAAAVLKHVEENEILYTMSYNPSYCWILGLLLGPFFTQRHRDPQQAPKTITQLYSCYIYNILKNHGREIESPRDVLLRVGQMAFTGVSEKQIVFTDGDLIKYNLQPSQFLSGFLMELLEREDSGRSVVYTFPHLTIQEFVAALAQFLTPDPGDILKLLTEFHSMKDGRFEIFLRFVAGLSSPGTVQGLEEFLGPFPHETTYRVIDWVKEEVQRQSGNTGSKSGKRSLLNTLHYLFESQNRGLPQAALGSVETLSFSELRLTPIDCAVLSHVIGLCDTINHLDLWSCHIQCEGIQRLGPGLHKCQDLGLGINDLGDSGVKLVSAALRDPECKIQRLGLGWNRLTDSGAEDLASALSTNRSLTVLDLDSNELGDSGMKLVSAALRDPECKIQELRLGRNRLTYSGCEDLASALSTNRSLTELELSENNLGDLGVNLVSAALRNPECKIQKLWLGRTRLTDSGAKHLAAALSTNRSLTELELSGNKLEDSGVKLVSAALRDPECKIQELQLWGVGLTDFGAKDLASALRRNRSLTWLVLGSNSLTDRSVPALRRLILTLPRLERIWLDGNRFSSDGQNQLKSLQGTRPGLRVSL